MKKSLAVFGQVFAQIYGQGETPMTITGLRREDHALGDDSVLGSVGLARTGVEVAVVDSVGRPVAPGEVGEIVCRSDVVMAGYWRNPAGTAETLRGGWLYTGDIGSIGYSSVLECLSVSSQVRPSSPPPELINGGDNYSDAVGHLLLQLIIGRYARVAHFSMGADTLLGSPKSQLWRLFTSRRTSADSS